MMGGKKTAMLATAGDKTMVPSMRLLTGYHGQVSGPHNNGALRG